MPKRVIYIDNKYRKGKSRFITAMLNLAGIQRGVHGQNMFRGCPVWPKVTQFSQAAANAPSTARMSFRMMKGPKDPLDARYVPACPPAPVLSPPKKKSYVSYHIKPANPFTLFHDDPISGH